MSEDPTKRTGGREEIAEGVFVRTASDSDADAVRDLVFGVLREYGLRPDPAGIDSDLDSIERNYLAPGGAFEVLEDADGRMIGTVGLFPMDGATVELRKMYFANELRGRGVGKLLLKRTLATAARLGFSRVTLETASVLKEAIGLYTSFGFRDIPGAHSDRCDRAFFLDL